MGFLTNLVPLPYRILIAVALFVASTGFGFVKGITYESDRHVATEVSLQKAVDAQTTHTADVINMQNNISNGIANEYKTYIDSHGGNDSGVRNNSSSSMPSVPNSAGSSDERLNQCLKKAEKLDLLRKWIIEEGAATNSQAKK